MNIDSSSQQIKIILPIHDRMMFSLDGTRLSIPFLTNPRSMGMGGWVEEILHMKAQCVCGSNDTIVFVSFRYKTYNYFHCNNCRSDVIQGKFDGTVRLL